MRATAKGEQIDFVEVIERNDDGLIQLHEVYWGWWGFAVLAKSEHERKTAQGLVWSPGCRASPVCPCVLCGVPSM